MILGVCGYGSRPEQAVGSPPVLARRNEWLMHLQGTILSILYSAECYFSLGPYVPIDVSQTPFFLVKTLDGQGLVVLFRRGC